MHSIGFIFVFTIFISLTSCSKDINKKSVLTEKDLNFQVIEAYQEGMKSLKEGDVIFAAKKFNEVEILFPQSEWAPKSSLMAAYSYYVQDYYADSIAELIRFTEVYPRHKNLDYAYYLMATCYYEQIVDEKKDLKSILNAKRNFEIIIKEFPKTDYANDSKFKIGLIEDLIAAKEMYVGRYYFDKKKWIPAINRFRTVIDEYDTTIYTEEALHRLVEIYYILGLTNESEKYAQLLGYNYKSSQWYEKSYAIFNKLYKVRDEERQNTLKKKNKKIIKKFKSLFDWDEKGWNYKTI